MTLDIVDTNTSQENLNRGISAAQDFLDQHMIMPHLVYKNVLLKAQGKPHIEGMVELWEQVQDIAIEAAFHGNKPEGFPALICNNQARCN